jgi:cell division protein FtsB
LRAERANDERRRRADHGARGRCGAVVAGLVLLALLPTRSWLNQRSQIRDAERRLAEMRVVNDRLQRRVDALSTPAEVDQVARAQFSLVKPGEAAYALLPLPKITIDALPAQWPYTVIQQVVAVRR